MGIIVKILGTGLSLASEAIHHARSRSHSGRSSPNPAAPNSAYASTSSARSPPIYDAPGEYVEFTDEAAANELIRSGRAERVVDHADGKNRGHPSKAAAAGYAEHGSSEDSGDDSQEVAGELADDEAAWELDEMAARMAPPSYEESEGSVSQPHEQDSEEVKAKKEEQMVRDLVRMAGPPPQPAQGLPCSVILPQRRPRNKDRGFVRAYAPVLADCGISQDVFLKFLTDWHQASKASPWIDVVFVAAGIAGFAPSISAQIVSTVVQVVAGTARELQSRHRRNTFLDRVNQSLLMPRGLYAMVMAFKDEVPGQQQRGGLSGLASTLGKTLFAAERLDINQTVAKYSNPDPNLSKFKKGIRDIRLTNGKTYNEVELPEAAPLIYPDLDRAVQQDLEREAQDQGKGPEKKDIKEKWKSAGEFVQDYLDRRAQAQFEAQHQGSKLAVPSSQRTPFASRFSDPNHPANSGSLIALLTGGAVDPKGRRLNRRAERQERLGMRREYRDMRRMARGRSPRGPREFKEPRDQRQRLRGLIKKIMQQDVLYLLIVNLPSQEEVQQSVAHLEHAVTEASRY
ncbi:hypothetical protein QBC46DRAFT_394899 [Diplogelasinospora grovesii]|uniref:Uncharacterized protein n=1 Tax=Diplogelasinospora grovesii TaxID=303347 RepID=A0AAN6S1N0_9PEZI|nr:hypothetical protein QBC46DRAFT_394899 [Diplogelasinospora grovesii]